MNFLKHEIDTVERLTPGLLAKLDAVPFLQKESRGNPALEIYRLANGPALIIPTEYGGMGTQLVDAIRFQRALAASAPSLALASNMHHFTVALLAEFAVTSVHMRHLLRMTAENRLYLASGFAEGATGQSTLTPHMTAVPTENGYCLNGSKKPCSLSRSMDILTASVGVVSEKGKPRFGVAIVPANTRGLFVEDFWASPILAGAESDEVILNDAIVGPKNMLLPGDEIDPAAIQSNSFVWFQLLTSSCYLGMASALAAQLINSRKGSAEDRVAIASELEGAMAMLEGVAYSFQAGKQSDSVVARSLFVRYAVQETLMRTVARASEMLGGIAFISSDRISYLIAAVRCLAFHPPAKSAVSVRLDQFLSGESFTFV